MNKRSFGFLALIGGLILAAWAPVEQPTPRSITLATAASAAARGVGTISFGEHGDGRGLLDFEIEISRKATTGRLEFAADSQHGDDGHGSTFPDVVVRMDTIDSAEIHRRKVSFRGSGFLLNQPVYIEVSAFDGEGTRRSDHFEIRVKDEHGHIEFEAEGDLFIGDLSIGEVN